MIELSKSQSQVLITKNTTCFSLNFQAKKAGVVTLMVIGKLIINYGCMNISCQLLSYNANSLTCLPANVLKYPVIFFDKVKNEEFRSSH